MHVFVALRPPFPLVNPGWFQDVVRCRGKLLATLAVFVVSSLVHEYALMLVFNFFFPLLLLQFGVFGGELDGTEGKQLLGRGAQSEPCLWERVSSTSVRGI